MCNSFAFNSFCLLYALIVAFLGSFGGTCVSCSVVGFLYVALVVLDKGCAFKWVVWLMVSLFMLLGGILLDLGCLWVLV